MKGKSLNLCRPETDVMDDMSAELVAEFREVKEVGDDIPDPEELEPQILQFIDQVVARARDTGAFTAAQGFAHERFKDDGNALNFCLFRLDQAQAASAIPGGLRVNCDEADQSRAAVRGLAGLASIWHYRQ